VAVLPVSALVLDTDTEPIVPDADTPVNGWLAVTAPTEPVPETPVRALFSSTPTVPAEPVAETPVRATSLETPTVPTSPVAETPVSKKSKVN
jgi:hypothetical protein